MLILGISGRKQSGKSTAGNFMYSLYMHEHKIAEEVYIDELGRIVVSDLFGDQNYSGVFDPTKRVENDYMISKVFKKLDPIVKIYNFADPLKNLCIDILGLKHSQCYGTDEQKNQKVDCYWDNKQLTARGSYANCWNRHVKNNAEKRMVRRNSKKDNKRKTKTSNYY